MGLFDPDALAGYERDGFAVVKNLLSSEEVELLSRIARADRALAERAASRNDGGDGVIRLALSNDLGDDVYSAIVRSRRIVDRMEQILGGEVYHYHHKMILKDARIGGAWEWHQDYGYWYETGCLFPDLASCFIAVDPATRANGCLQILAGSQRLGRINHGPIGDQSGADPERVAEALKRLPRVHVEMAPGSAVFFHCNALHRSDANVSPDPRWSFICCYNSARNDPYKRSRHPFYSRLDKWDDRRILEAGSDQWASLNASSIV